MNGLFNSFVFDRTTEIKAYEVTASVSRVKIFGIRVGFSSRDLACKASKLLAGRPRCAVLEGWWSAEIGIMSPELSVSSFARSSRT